MINDGERVYGTRKCLQCGNEFDAGFPAQIVCSTSCMKIRRRDQKRASSARGRARRKKYLLDLLAEMDQMRKEIASLKEQLAEASKQTPLQYEVCSPTKGSTNSSLPDKGCEIEKIRPYMKECKRMHLRAMNLPCGLREECYTPLCDQLRIEVQAGERLCRNCKKPFSPKSQTQSFCSSDCRSAFAAKAR